MANGNLVRHVYPVTFDEHGNVPADGSGVTFADLHADLIAESAQVGALADRGVVTKELLPGRRLVLVGNDPVLNVFNLDMPPGGLSGAVLDITAPPGSTVLVNVHGDDLRIKNTAMHLTGVTRDTVLFNFPEATQVVFTGFTLTGSLLAPHASAVLSGGSVEGRAVFGGDVYAHTGFEFHNYPFSGELCITEPGVVPYIAYRFTVMNTGSVTLTNVTIADPLVTVMGGPIALAPGQSDDATFSGVYLLTPEDLAAGSFTNTATAGGTAPNGTVVTASDSDVQVFPPPDTGLSLNGRSGDIRVGRSEPVSLALTLNAGLFAGLDADWWLLALPQQGVLWYCLGPDGAWMPVAAGRPDAFQPAYQGPLVSLRLPVPGLRNVTLQPGVYTLIFAVDPLDGLLNYPGGPILYDALTVTVR